MTPAKPAILFLIPDARLRDIYVSRFERDGWEVDAATNLTDAERRSVQLRPQVMLLHYAVMDDAKAVLKRLHSLPTLQKTRIVVLDKHLPRTITDELLRQGADQVIMTAHLTPQELVKRLTQLIEL